MLYVVNPPSGLGIRYHATRIANPKLNQNAKVITLVHAFTNCLFLRFASVVRKCTKIGMPSAICRSVPAKD